MVQVLANALVPVKLESDCEHGDGCFDDCGMDHSARSFTLNMILRTHYLLEIDSNQFLVNERSAPDWVEDSLRETPFVVVRRGVVMGQKIPIGVRGAERSQRWASFCRSQLIKRIVTPPQLLDALPAIRANDAPALRALQLLKERWMDLDHPWGPGGSVCFELATGKEVVNPASDLDVVIYAETRISLTEAKSLWTRTLNLPTVVDIRVETPVYGFSLGEFVRQSPRAILLRSPDGFSFGIDPWTNEAVMETEKV